MQESNNYIWHYLLWQGNWIQANEQGLSPAANRLGSLFTFQNKFHKFGVCRTWPWFWPHLSDFTVWIFTVRTSGNRRAHAPKKRELNPIVLNAESFYEFIIGNAMMWKLSVDFDFICEFPPWEIQVYIGCVVLYTALYSIQQLPLSGKKIYTIYCTYICAYKY